APDCDGESQLPPKPVVDVGHLRSMSAGSESRQYRLQRWRTGTTSVAVVEMPKRASSVAFAVATPKEAGKQFGGSYLIFKVSLKRSRLSPIRHPPIHRLRRGGYRLRPMRTHLRVHRRGRHSQSRRP